MAVSTLVEKQENQKTMQKTMSLHSKAPRRKKSCDHRGMSPSNAPNVWDAQICISQHNHSDKPSEETVLDSSDVRE